MARLPRNKVANEEAWYHLYNFVGAHIGEFPLQKTGAREQFMNLLEHYANIYCCDVLTAVCMGNHFHIVARFETHRELDREALFEKALLFYPDQENKILAWPEEKWERLNRRIYDLSEFMKSIQQTFATWFNATFDRKGRFWGDRFKNTILTDFDERWQCMLYVDLNAFRAGIVDCPEAYQYSTLYRRLNEKCLDLLPLSAVWGAGPEADLKIYLEFIYNRSAVRTKANQCVLLPEEIEKARQIRAQEHEAERYFIDGLVVGSKAVISEWLEKLRAKGIYRRRKNPVQQGSHGLFTIREQRSNHISLK